MAVAAVGASALVTLKKLVLWWRFRGECLNIPAVNHDGQNIH